MRQDSGSGLGPLVTGSEQNLLVFGL